MIAAIAALALLSVLSPVLAQISSISLLEHSLLGTRYSNWWRTLVQMTSKIQQPLQNPSTQAQNTTASGSGFVYDKQGHIITNSHVVGNAKIVDVTFVDGYSYAAKVIGTDIYTDIAE